MIQTHVMLDPLVSYLRSGNYNIKKKNIERTITSKNWEELGDISAPIDVKLAALLCDRCGKSLSLSIRWAAECSLMSCKNCCTCKKNRHHNRIDVF